MLFAMVVQSAYADNTLTLEASTTEPDTTGATGDSPEHIYTIHNNHAAEGNLTLYWKEDLKPTSNKKDVGTFAFYKVEDKNSAYYIYDCSMGQWLTYEVKDSYSAQHGYITLSDKKNAQAYFIFTPKKNGGEGYDIQLVNTNGESASVY